MTQLLTRRSFLQRLASLGPDLQGVLMMADIDRFKSINDTYGHLIGDKVIQSVAQIIRQAMASDGMAARFGGEEFVAFLPITEPRLAILRAEAIRQAVEDQRVLESGMDLGCTISIGLSEIAGASQIETVLNVADQALYRAKSEGRNRLVLASAGTDPSSHYIAAQ